MKYIIMPLLRLFWWTLYLVVYKWVIRWLICFPLVLIWTVSYIETLDIIKEVYFCRDKYDNYIYKTYFDALNNDSLLKK